MQASLPYSNLCELDPICLPLLEILNIPLCVSFKTPFKERFDLGGNVNLFHHNFPVTHLCLEQSQLTIESLSFRYELIGIFNLFLFFRVSGRAEWIVV